MKVKIKEYLKSNGIQQKELAEKLGISQVALTKRLAKGIACNVSFLGQVASALDTSVLNLIEDDRSVVVSSFRTEEGMFEVRKYN